MIPLRTYSKEIYQTMKEGLASSHIHPHDVRAFAEEKEGETEIHLYYGEDYAHHESRSFQDGEEMKPFFEEVAATCQEAMIADYFKMMKP